jgi:pimeloyl-ACP methyl ester carboxylesterase
MNASIKVFSSILTAIACGAAAAAGQASDAPPLPAPGRLVDVGGWRLHLNCTGEAKPDQPRVILESGVGDFSVEWSLVQPGVAGFARVCSYDRAGDGWSELGPHPRTFHQIVYELHTLLANAGERPPYVLVGHSYGGWLVRLYQTTYPTEVAGMVLVEAGADNPLRMMPDGRVMHASDLASGQPVPAVKTSGPLRESDIPAAALAQIRAGLSDASARANEPPRDKLPADAQRMRTWALGQVKHVVAAVNPAEADELAQLRADRMKSDKPLGDLPLIVITRGKSEQEGPDSRATEAEHRKDHAMIAGLSRRGRLIVAERSGHHVQLDEPALVVQSIREVLAGPSKPGGQSYTIDALRRSCIEFTSVKRGSGPENIGDCRVSAFGTLGTIENRSYYFALYCLVLSDQIGQGTCSGDSFNSRYHRARGLVVFEGDRSTAHVLFERVNDDIGMYVYAEPEVARTAAGTILYLPIRVDGTGNYNESEYYLRKGGAWQRLDFDSWQKELVARVPPGREIWKGLWPNLKTMRVETGLYRKGDGNCCPSGGTIRARLAIRDMRFVIASTVVDTIDRPR